MTKPYGRWDNVAKFSLSTFFRRPGASWRELASGAPFAREFPTKDTGDYRAVSVFLSSPNAFVRTTFTVLSG